MEKDNIETIKWTFQAFPSQNFKDTFAGALLEYVQGTQDWDYVVTTVKDSWKSERAQQYLNFKKGDVSYGTSFCD